MSAHKSQALHTHVLTNWRALLACWKCKQCFTYYLAQEMLSLVPQLLKNTQVFVMSTGETLPCPQLCTNAEEAAQRVWLHCVHSAGTRKLIFSPNVYHVGLALLSRSEIVVQLSKSFKEGSKFLHLKRSRGTAV